MVYLGFLLFFLLVATFFGGAMLVLSRWMDRDDARAASRPREPAIVVRAVALPIATPPQPRPPPPT